MSTRIPERALVWAIRLTTYSIVFIVGWILFDILKNGIPALSWGFLTEFPKRGGAAGGILPAIVGTLCLVAGTVVIAFPLGIMSAVYLAEYASDTRLTRLIRAAISTLAGVPSIVFGLFGLGLFVVYLGFGSSILAGSLTLACMVLPTVIVAAEEALRTIPQSFRDGSLALGATRWQTLRHNVLPYAVPGMLTGAILAVGRAAGETAPILLTAAAFFLTRLPRSVFDPVMALPYHLYILATQHPDVNRVRPLQYGTALVLIALVFSANIAAIALRSHYRKKYKW